MVLHAVLQQILSIGLLIPMEKVWARSHCFVRVRIDEAAPIRWLPSGYGPVFYEMYLERLSRIQVEQSNLFHTCTEPDPASRHPIEWHQHFDRDDLIQKVESVIAYNGETFHEFIPSTSPLKGFSMTFPNPPTSPHQVLMDFVWGFHICNIVERSCHRWYFGTDKWIPMPDLNFPHAEVRDMIQINQTWWIFGGYGEKQSPDNTYYPNQLCEYLDDRGRWNQGPKYLIRYLEGIGVISDSVVMAVGGAHTPKNYNSFIISVTEFDIVKGFLGHRFSLSRRMFGVTCRNFVALNGTKLILCLGGTYSQSEPQFSNETYVYNLETGGWMEMPEWQFPEPVSFSNLAWFQGNLYVIGARYGESDRNTVYRFDETTQPAWTVVDMLPDHPEEYSRVRTFTRSLVIF